MCSCPAPIKEEDHESCSFSWDGNNAHCILPQDNLRCGPVSQHGPWDPVVWRCIARHAGLCHEDGLVMGPGDTGSSV